MQQSVAKTGVRLADLLTRETIKLDLQAADWRQAVRLAGQVLFETGSITAPYIDAMVRAVEELGPYMVVAPGIALAHARPEDGVKRVCMSLIRLASPVEFGSKTNDPVHLVFAFGAVDKEVHLQALKELATFLQKEEAVAALGKCNSAEEAVQLIKKYSGGAQSASEGSKQVSDKRGFELYLDRIQDIINDIREKQASNLLEAAEMIAASLGQGGVLHVFGTSHSQLLAQEIFYRAGCLAPTNAIIEPALGLRKASENCYWYERQEAYGKVVFDAYHMEPGDVIVVISTSGRNEVPVEVALQVKKRGLKVIALLSLPYSSHVEARHSSGKKLSDVADVILDNRATLGDAAIELEGIPCKVGPTSGVIGAVILQALVVQVTEALASKGVQPPIWVSINLPRGTEINAEYLERYKDRIKHL